ncbi:TonB-dependent Receptor Plug Domain [Granulicella pectinivorans]|uniref:TonB-dependent Receptor Plug Domain n=1 Tax=Granulicella pectinivorans TaxID=474950 RepID=A0A1I6ME31_9BACT|nr:carboxypeptidase regulatory-like domain-containing protein [Granulicella pectinivorans]SFS13862.1 TonB-dependent Receptor Plug Domain [Granulicella pectinivorans]
MKRLNLSRVLLLLLFLVGVGAWPALAQTLTSATITGIVTDTSGALVPKASVKATQTETGAVNTTTSNGAGEYRFPFLNPGSYLLTAESDSLSAKPVRLQLAVGQERSVTLRLGISSVQQSVEVTDTATLLQTENANNVTSYSKEYVENTPVNGGDITNIAFSTPGIRLNVGGGNTNFNVNGLPFSSVLFTVNGADIVEPYNLNNKSGSSNNTLGANDVSEASVITNAYSAQYGREAGAQVNYISKSGANQFHGNLVENYNSQIFNANDYFNNQSGTPRGRAVANQYAASLGGPVYIPHWVDLRDKLTFFVNTEGLRYALPTTGVVSLPTTAFQQYVLANVPASALPYYQQLFKVYNGAPGLSRAVNVTNGSGQLQDGTGNQGCGNKGFSGTVVPGGSGAIFGGTTGLPCAVAFRTTASSLNTEYYVDGRVDWNINTKHKLYFHISRDYGVQASSTSPLNPVFNQVSPQPWVIPQVNYTYVITPKIVNNFILNGNYYSAVTGPTDFAAAQTLLPLAFSFSDGGAGNNGLQTASTSVPNGRLGQQLGIIDDFSWERGRHTLQFGVNNRNNRISSTANKSGSVIGTYAFGSLADFASGSIVDSKNLNSFTQGFPVLPSVHIRVDSLGFYGQDEWKLRDNLSVTFGARFEYQGNPSCKENCYSRANTVFLGSGYSNSAATPYNATLQTGINKDFQQFEGVITEPRFGFAYSPFGKGKTVVRGGIGLFANTIAASITASVFGNAPYKFTPKVTTGSVGLSSNAGSSQANAIASANAFQNGFANGSTFAQLSAAVPNFSQPTLYVNPNKFHTIKVLEWSLEIEHPLTTHDVVSATYSGTHGYNEPLTNSAANGSSTSGFGGLAKTNPDPRFSTVSQIYDTGYSWYNGLTLLERHAFRYHFQGQISYTWSKALALTTIYNPTAYSVGTLTPTGSVTDNYGPTNFDTRHNLSADLVYSTPKFSNHLLNRTVGGWKTGSKLYLYSGRPFTVTDTGINGSTHGLSSTFSGTILADTTNPGAIGTHCGSAAVRTACLTTASFATAAAQSGFGNTKPNSFRGPGFFSVATQLAKDINVTEHSYFELGADAYNLFNHVNFAVPVSDVNKGSTFGTIASDVSVPTSIYGTGQGAIVSGRVLVVFGKFIF